MFEKLFQDIFCLGKETYISFNSVKNTLTAQSFLPPSLSCRNFYRLVVYRSKSEVLLNPTQPVNISAVSKSLFII